MNGTKGVLPVPFCVELFRFNEAKQTGGELMKLENHIGCGSSHDAMEKGTITVMPAIGKGHPTTLHIRFIDRINGEKVYW